MTTEQRPVDVPVLVVGGGPVGLMASILLSAQGVDNRVLERRVSAQQAPAAHVVNARTFEIMRAAGVDMTRIAAACRPTTDGWVRWVTSLAGEELGHVPFERLDRFAELDDVTPTPLRNLSQHLLEPILRDHVPSLTSGCEWLGATQDADAVVSIVRNVATGATHEIRSRYLIGADGAGSPVRRWAGIIMDGPQRLESILSIHVEVDLRAIVAERPATLYWLLDPDLGGTYLAHDVDSTWVYMHRWNPDVERIEDYTVERCEGLFRRGIGAEVGEIAVRSITPWNMSCQVADRYRAERVFLIGDAAHRFPPTGGMGLNTGVVDAQNLAWKLAAVENGWAGAEILSTYEAERRPIAQTNAQQSMENAMKLFEVWMAIGADPDPATSRANYATAISTAEGRERVRVAAEGQIEHFDMIGLQLGFSYSAEDGLVLDDGTAALVTADPVRDYVPNTRPGARLPHAWIEREGVRISTLDLVPLDRFVLLTAAPGWAVAGERTTGSGVPLDVVLIGRDVGDPHGNWARVCGLDHNGAILIRPDQHVCWRAATLAADPQTALADALAGLIQRPAGGFER